MVLAGAALTGFVAVIAAAGAIALRNDSTSHANTLRTDSTCDGKLGDSSPTYITAWFHAGGATTVETKTLGEQVRAFNASQREVHVKLVTLPVGDYAKQVAVAAAHGDLPDVLDFDGPNLYNYAWSGKLKPIDSCVSRSVRRDLLPSIVRQGTYAKRLWGVGTFDSGLGLYVRPSILTKAGIRIPRGTSDAWTAAEFTRILKRLRRRRVRTTARSAARRAESGVVHVRLRAGGLVGRRRPDRPGHLPQGRRLPQRPRRDARLHDPAAVGPGWLRRSEHGTETRSKRAGVRSPGSATGSTTGTRRRFPETCGSSRFPISARARRRIPARGSGASPRPRRTETPLGASWRSSCSHRRWCG